MVIDRSIHLVQSRCRSLATSYQEIQEMLLSCLSTSTSEQRIQQSASIAAYDLALCSIQRLRNIIMNCHDNQRSDEQAQCLLLNGLTKEVLFLGTAKEQTWGRDLSMGKDSSHFQHYHQAQAQALGPVLLEIKALLVPVFTRYVTDFIGEEQIQSLDAQPYWSDTMRCKAVAEVCQRLSSEGKLDETYAVIARELMKIDFPRDIHSEEDRYTYCALPTHVRRLLIRDLLAFIAGLKVESFAAEDANTIAMIGCAGAAQSLLERRAAEVPVPTLSLRAEIYSQTVPLLEKVHVVAIHPEPCLLCSTHGGHCDYWQVTFPDGTNFGEATQTESDQLQHIYSFTPILPSGPSNGLRIFLDYCGIWEPDRPWKLTALNPSMD